MKNRKTALVAFLLCAVMLIGVGFAEISGSLTIGGTASSGAQHFNVVFTSVTATITDAETDGSVVTATVENQKLTDGTPLALGTDGTGLARIGLKAENLAVKWDAQSSKGDKVVCVFTIKNNNNVPMYLTPSVTGNSLFDVTAVLGTTSPVAADGETTLTVTVTLKDDAIVVGSSEEFTVTVSATSTAPQPQN